QAAFQPQWWDGAGFKVTFDGQGKRIIALGNPSSTNEFTVMEANFTLFFGLAVQRFEQTLIANDSRFDRFMEALQANRDGSVPPGSHPDPNALTAEEQAGLQVFLGTGGCINCHGGPELTNASVRNVTNQKLER